VLVFAFPWCNLFPWMQQAAVAMEVGRGCRMWGLPVVLLPPTFGVRLLVGVVGIVVGIVVVSPLGIPRVLYHLSQCWGTGRLLWHCLSCAS